MDEAGLSRLRKPIPYVHASLQSESHRDHAAAARQDPPHSEGELSVSKEPWRSVQAFALIWGKVLITAAHISQR